jgi:hypothetical protein
LRLLHRECDEIVTTGIDAARAARGSAPREAARVDLDQLLRTPDRQAHTETFAVDEIGLGRQAHERHVVAGEQQLRTEQRAIRRSHDQDVVLALHLHRPPNVFFGFTTTR